MARQKARGKELCQAASVFAQAVAAWAEDLEKRRHRHAPVLFSSPSTPILTGVNALLLPDELAEPPTRNLAEAEASVPGSTGENPRPFGPELLLAELQSSYQLNLAHAGDSERAWKDFMATENDTDFRNSYSREYLKHSDSTLPGFGAQFNNQVFKGAEVNYIGVGIGFAMRGIPLWQADSIAAIRKYIAILNRSPGYHPMTEAEYNWMKFGYDYAIQRLEGVS
jgi:hypothetical protein